MKVILKVISLLWMCIFASCNGNKQNSNQTDIDSIRVVEPIDNHDSKKFFDEHKVIADLNFFITKEDFSKNERNYLSSMWREDWLAYFVGDYNAGYNPDAYFENDSLYYINFKGRSFDIEDYNGKLKSQYKKLNKLYTSKYGRPDFETYSFPALYDTNPGYYHELSRWDLGKKTISIRLSENSSHYFHIELVIYRNDIEKRVRDRKEKESKEQQSSASAII